MPSGIYMPGLRYCAAFTAKLTGTEPRVTAVVPRKFFPVMITVSPGDPIAGESFVIAGCGFGRRRSRLKIVAPTNVPELFAYGPVVDPQSLPSLPGIRFGEYCDVVC
jgi:hypothetical protein